MSMATTTFVQIENPIRNDRSSQDSSRFIENLQAKTTSYRAFGRELSNFETRREPSGNIFKDNELKTQRSSENSNLEEESSDLDELMRRRNPQYVETYVKEIFNNLRETEEKYIAQPGYMARTQKDISERMRAILIDWLVDVHLKFKLASETLFLSINLIDRYLEKETIARQKLQLVGCAAMLIASKYEDIHPPEVKDFVFVSDKSYTKEEILEMEGNILSCLKFNLTTPSSLTFLERYGIIAKLDEKMMNLAKYFLELILVDYKMLKYVPSTIACSIIYLINKIHKREAWPEIMIKEAKYLEIQLRPCARDLVNLLQIGEKSSNQAVRKKFSSVKYMQVSRIQFETDSGKTEK